MGPRCPAGPGQARLGEGVQAGLGRQHHRDPPPAPVGQAFQLWTDTGWFRPPAIYIARIGRSATDLRLTTTLVA